MNALTPLLEQRIKKFINEVTIYPVSCEKLAHGRPDIEWLDAVLAGGARIVQLRDKESDSLAVFEKAKIFRQKTKEAGALFIVNDRVDIALMSDADGVHLGNNDVPVEEARKIAPDLIIGVSCNTEEQAATAQSRGASYFNIGPLFATQTKGGLSSFLGPEAITTFSARCDLPFTVMGGIKKDHIPKLTALGAKRIAVVTALTQAENIEQETSEWINAILNNIEILGK